MLAHHHLHSPALAACAAEGITEESRLARLTRLFNTVISATVPSSFGAVVLQASLAAGSATQAVAVWLPPGVEVSEAALEFHGLGGCSKALSGSSRPTRLPALLKTIPSRAKRAAGGGKVYQLAFLVRVVRCCSLVLLMMPLPVFLTPSDVRASCRVSTPGTPQGRL